MLDILEPESLCERLDHQSKGFNQKRPFARPSHQDIQEEFDIDNREVSALVGFKSKNYAVAENGIHVAL